jgi:ketosteroid isomerase-like protein
MFRRLLSIFPLIAITTAVASCRGGEPVQADTIIAMERAALDRWGHGDPQGYLETYARDVTYFDPMRERRIDGLDAMKQALEPIKGLVKIDNYEMIAPHVQRTGDAAILTYNLVSHGRLPDGAAVVARWNSTAVYGRVDGGWKILHSHWSYTKPELKAPGQS